MAWLLPVVGVAAAGVAAMVVLRRHLAVMDVEGPSMEPTFRAGDRVLVRRTRLARVRAGDVIVIERPKDAPRPGFGRAPADGSRRRLSEGDWLIKRAAAVPGDPLPPSVVRAVSAPAGSPVPEGFLVALGDNPAMSYDSRSYGYFRAEHVLGVVLRRA